MVGIERCIPYSDRIARRILRWSRDPYDDSRDHTVHLEPQDERFVAFLKDEVPFLDPFTGKWIHPHGEASAGSSRPITRDVDPPKISKIEEVCFASY